MIANETIKDAKHKLSSLLAELDCEWKRETLKSTTNPETGTEIPQYRFTTVVASTKLYVTENYVGFSKEVHTEEGLFEDRRELGNGATKSDLYKKLVRRFDDDKDIRYFSEIYESISRLLEQQENEDQDDDDDRPIQLADGRTS